MRRAHKDFHLVTNVDAIGKKGRGNPVTTARTTLVADSRDGQVNFPRDLFR